MATFVTGANIQSFITHLPGIDPFDFRVTSHSSGQLTLGAGDDQITLTGSGFKLNLLGLPAEGEITGFTWTYQGQTVVSVSNVAVSVADIYRLDLSDASALVMRFAGDADVLYGGAGNDDFSAWGGNDVIFGGAGDDELDGGSGSDWVEGGDGNDLLFSGGGGRDVLLGGGGNDALWANLNGSLENVVLSGGHGADLVVGGAGNDWVDGGFGDDSIDYVYAGDGDDSVVGGGGMDFLLGQGGNDTIVQTSGTAWLDGGAGNDSLWGADGWDILFGGPGSDLLVGRGGNDVIVFARTDITAGARDVVSSFGNLAGDHDSLRFDGIAHSELSIVQQSGGVSLQIALVGGASQEVFVEGATSAALMDNLFFV